MRVSSQLNVLGTRLQPCCFEPITGFTRNGFCERLSVDRGSHTVCAIVTSEFLNHQRSRGNDLISPRPEYGFPGLKDGDKWCLCALRWKEAFNNGIICKVILESTHASTLDLIDMDLQEFQRFSANPSQSSE